MNRRAITLLEVLIALGLGITLLSSVAGFTWTQLSARREIMETASARQTLSLVFDRIDDRRPAFKFARINPRKCQ